MFPAGRRRVGGARFTVKSVHIYVVECLARESPPRAGELAERFGISRMTLTRWFRRQLKMTPSSYLRQARMTCARRMLRGTSLTNTAVAYRSGFGTRRTFYRSFHNQAALSPAELRGKRQEKNGPEKPPGRVLERG
jgi:transcriptional regulator GlxA family with amidase domain